MVISLAIASSQVAHAGQVELVSDVLDKICVVEIMKGEKAPDLGKPARFEGVERGKRWFAQDKICWRRSGDPGACDSPLTEWTCGTAELEQGRKFSLR